MAETKFSVMVSLFNWTQKSKSSSIKRSKFRKFLDTFCRPGNGDDYFSAIRLILPALDRERGSYGLREHVLATCLIDALGMSRDSPDSQRLLKWRKAGPKAGAFAGNFSLIAAEVLQRRQGMASGGLTISQLNDLLDRLASSEDRSNKTSVLSELIRKTNAQEMKWIIMIILKDLKLGISEKSIFHEFHPDAEDLFNVTCDLKLVCEKLRDRRQRHKRQDIEVGKPVRPQLALRVGNVAAAWKKLHGKDVVVECKFDGDRIQIHKNGADVNFFSRNFLDHPEYEHGISGIIRENILVDRCIIDGEMLVWDTSSNSFAEFGSNQEIAKAAKVGLDSNRQLCYVAFDVLYVGDTSVIHQSLKERHQLLKKVVKPVAGRLEILVPDGGLNEHQAAGEPCRSLIAHDAESVERFFKETVENRDEGIVLKDLSSKWEPGDRTGKWLKLKPDYVRAGSDLDVLIIGGYYGSGRHGGEVAQFLVGLAESSAHSTYPRRFVSFCRVGTGLSDEELTAVVTKLKPYLRKNEYPKKPPPSCYQVTNNSKERPDVWVESPEKSLILSITSDIRTIRSEVFAAPYSLRFPRIDQVRYDKPWYECLNVQSFIELVHSSNGTTQRAVDTAVPREDEPRHVNLSKGVKRKNVSVPLHFLQTDVSGVMGETSIFSNMTFYFANVPPSQSLDSLHKMVVENGGTFSMNLNNSVTHCIASESKGIKFQAAKLQGDVISFSWFSESCSQKKLLPLHPKYFLHLSDTTKKNLEEEIDEFSDSYYLDLNAEDLKQLFGNIREVGDPKEREFYKKKLCPMDKWIRFHGCQVYFHFPRQFLKNKSWEVPLEFAMRRMKNEICSGGGSVSERLVHATHLVVISGPQADMDFNSLLNSFSEPDRLLLRRKGLQIVGSQWLEDSFEKDQKLPEHNYSLKPQGFESLTEASYEHEAATEPCHVLARELKDGSSPEKEGKAISPKQRIVSLPKRQRTRKAGLSSRTNETKEQQVIDESRRKMPRVRKKVAKIEGYDSDNHASSDGKEEFESTSSSCRPGMLRKKGRSVLSQLRRKRAQIRSKPANIGGDQLDVDTFADKQQTLKKDSEDSEGNCKASKTTKLPVTELQGRGEVEDYPSRIGEDAEPPLFPGHSEPSQGVHKVYELGCGGEGSSTQYEKRAEGAMDPVQAMLLNMVPALGEKKVQSVIPTTSQVQEATRNDPIDSRARPSVDAEMPPGKKKKVSYKDVANELLKDW